MTVLWLAAMGALFYREIWPAWTAQSPPRLATAGGKNDVFWNQHGIFDAENHRIGTAWSQLSQVGTLLRHESDVALEGLPMLPPVLIETDVYTTADGAVDNFSLDVRGIIDARHKPVVIHMSGENYGKYIPCTVQVGAFRRTFKLDAAASRLIGDGIRPFDTLRDLKVGQSWRMQMLDPLSAMLYQQAKITSVIARVERTETIEHGGAKVECFVVVAGRSRAWVAPDGRVLVQEADIPGFGRVTIRDEGPDKGARTATRTRIVGGSEGNESTIERTRERSAVRRGRSPD